MGRGEDEPREKCPPLSFPKQAGEDKRTDDEMRLEETSEEPFDI